MSQDVRATEEKNTRRRANLLRVRYFDTRTLERKPLFQGILSKEDMYEYRAVVLSQEKGQMIIAITIASPQHALEEMRERFKDYKLSFVMISEAGFKEFMLEYDPPEKVEYQDIQIQPGAEEESIADVSETMSQVRSDDLFNYLIRQAHKLEASDIHIETHEDDVRVRFRVDGVLHEIARIDYDKYRQLNSTIAIAANISTGADDAQTGHMEFKVTNDDGNEIADINMRIETIPTNYGQDAVIRLFTLDHSLLDLTRLGLDEDEQRIIDEVIARPTGLVLSVGPTGSGKTTTLYSIVKALNSTERKIITLEDPVEYAIPGVVQIPVDTSHKASFADKLRAVLRLDPDVIMVGEIRDADTAMTALQASLSGHLVLSTFHASDSAAALARLYEFISENPLATSAIRLIIAQRLVRTLDSDSKQEQHPDENLLQKVAAVVNTIREDKRPNLEGVTFFTPGKSEKAPFGYIGQTAIVEMLQVTPDIAHLLHERGASVDPEEIKQLAIQNGMLTLQQDALIKAIHGETSLEEVFRVVGRA